MRDLSAEGRSPGRPDERRRVDDDATVPIAATARPVDWDGAPEIPGYRVLRRIGTGVSSTVYLGLRIADKRGIALKVIAPAQEDDERVRRFLVECGRVSRLGAPCLARILDFGLRAGHVYAAM